MKRIFANLNWLLFLLVAASASISFFYFENPFWLILEIALLISITILVVFKTTTADRAERGLLRERERLTAIIENLHDGVMVYDQNFRVAVFNKAAQEIFGVSSDEVIGKSFTLKVREEHSDKLKPLLTILFPALAPAIVRVSEPGSYPQIFDISFDNPSMELRVSTNRIMDEKGNVLGFIKLIHDRTRELALLRSKGEFIAIASHQLRTPLTAINWSMENLHAEPLTETQQELVRKTTASVNRLLKITEDLLDVAKIEEGQFGYHFQDENIVAFIEEALRQADPVAKAYRVKLYFEKTSETMPVTIDIQRLGLAISNILDNAVKYNIPNGEVAVKIEKMKDKPYIVVSVRDTGIGIPENQIQYLFTRFFRADNAVKIKTEGTGLGLYIAKNIIRRHGGQIWAKSAVNRGTTMYFTLPTNPTLIPPKEFIYEE
ncbi:MAG: ATP-binding protein [Patescibacteria group bacterium]